MTKIAITGVGGRMGKRIAALAIESEKFDIVSAMEAGGHEALACDVGEQVGVGAFGLAVSKELIGEPEVIIDFSVPESTMAWLGLARERKLPMVIGTTGLTESQLAEVADSASAIPLVYSANMSVGINLLLKLVAQVARALGDDYDIDICETHHRFKKDAPSGTAIALAKSICDAVGRRYGDTVVLGRGGQRPRAKGEIGIHAVRIGDSVGEHTVMFGNLGETISLGHSAHTRDTFARGALRAAQWVIGKAPGLYDMLDVLGFK